MALTEIKTSGIADDAVTTDKLANAINTARDANTAKVSLADNAVTLAKMAGGTDGQIITYDASGDPVAVGPGTDGQVLTSTGAGSPPAFETPAAGVGGATGVDFNDNVKARFGTDNDLEISHNDTNGWIDNNKGALYIDTTTDIVARVNNNEDAIKAIANGAVELYHNNAKKFETTATGVDITGNCTITGNFRGNDNVKLNLGNGDDLQILHTGSESQIQCHGSSLHINKTDSENMAKFIPDDAVELYFDNTKRFETVDDGIKVIGNIELTGAIEIYNEFNMFGQGNKYLDLAYKDHYLYFRRVNDTDTGHSTHCTVNSSGEWSANFNDTSDEKLKENITAISDGAISKVKQLRPVNFDWKDSDKSNNVSGFIAQEIKTVLPNLVYGTEYDPTLNDPEQGTKGGIKSTGYSVNTIGIVANLTKALQESITKIETLETKVAALEAG
tara:strand:- start:132 stop:1466 length:1335 start_codon:yes stop_codon:yes gene_type:complete